MATLPGELLHQQRTNPVLVLLYFHQQHDVTARNYLQGEGAEACLHRVGFEGLEKWLLVRGKSFVEEAVPSLGS